MTCDLSRLLRPRSIAVIGGGVRCAAVRTVASLTDLPGVPDTSFIGVNWIATIETVRRLGAMGAGGAVCFASGFREAQAEMGDGDALHDQLLAAAGDMALIGPDCYGFINYLDGALLWPDQYGGVLITQSSNIAINLTMQRRGLPLAYVATAGNQAQTGVVEIGQALLEDPRATVLGLHIEGIGDLAAFQALADRECVLGKPIVALKVGKSEQARAAAVSHTASLAGNWAG